jgi:hypothetical protein
VTREIRIARYWRDCDIESTFLETGRPCVSDTAWSVQLPSDATRFTTIRGSLVASEKPDSFYLGSWNALLGSAASMNISYPPFHITNIPPEVERMGHELIKATAFLCIPAELLYFSIYFRAKGLYRVYEILTFLSLAAFWVSPVLAPISCSPARCMQNFASMPSSYLSELGQC